MSVKSLLRSEAKNFRPLHERKKTLVPRVNITPHSQNWWIRNNSSARNKQYLSIAQSINTLTLTGITTCSKHTTVQFTTVHLGINILKVPSVPEVFSRARRTEILRFASAGGRRPTARAAKPREKTLASPFSLNFDRFYRITFKPITTGISRCDHMDWHVKVWQTIRDIYTFAVLCSVNWTFPFARV